MKELPHRLGRIVCVIRGYTVTEVLAEAGVDDALLGYCVFGPGADNDAVYPTPEETMRVIDRLVDGI